jgi:cytosine/uracil/thiamine/allantoin permease
MGSLLLIKECIKIPTGSRYSLSFNSHINNVTMKKLFSYLLIILLSVFMSSCQVIGDIFKAGIWVGVLIVVAIIGLIIFLVTRSSNKN